MHQQLPAVWKGVLKSVVILAGREHTGASEKEGGILGIQAHDGRVGTRQLQDTVEDGTLQRRKKFSVHVDSILRRLHSHDVHIRISLPLPPFCIENEKIWRHRSQPERKCSKCLLSILPS